jgi:hypothetical protein
MTVGESTFAVFTLKGASGRATITIARHAAASAPEGSQPRQS